MEVKEKWKIVKGRKYIICSNLGNFLIDYGEKGEYESPPDDAIIVGPHEIIAETWMDIKIGKNQRVELIDGDKSNLAVSNLRIVDVPKNLTIRMEFNKEQITREMVNQVLKYVPETGAFLVKTKRPSVGSETWKHAGEVGTCYMISLFGQWYKAQEIAVLIMNGDWPCGPVDVENGNWGDARWLNIVV